MSPEADDLDDAFLLEDLVYETMLDVYPPRIRSRQISHKFVEGRRCLERVIADESKQSLGFRSKTGCVKLSGVFLGLPGKDKTPPYHPGSSEHLSIGAAIPSRMDSRILGIERR
jgi:hypothetical protein